MAAGHELGACPITVAEFYSGQDPGDRPFADAFIDSLTFWPIPAEVALVAGGYRWTFAKRGRQLGVADALIAATARHYGAVLVTSNGRDFPMTDITVVAPDQL